MQVPLGEKLRIAFGKPALPTFAPDYKNRKARRANRKKLGKDVRSALDLLTDPIRRKFGNLTSPEAQLALREQLQLLKQQLETE